MDSETGTTSGGKRGRGRGRGRGRPRGRGRGRGRPKKMVIESDEEEQIETSETVDNHVEIIEEILDVPQTVVPSDSFLALDINGKTSEKEQSGITAEFNLDDDISQLVPPTFSTIPKGPPQPMVELLWNQQYQSTAEKVPSPNIHMCETCRRPVRLYGRLIPCKHVFCHSCAKKQGIHCSRCSEKVHRIEPAQLGSVFMCSHEGSRYGYEGCRRTYLSQRDLQAHINHRHKPRNSVSASGDGISGSTQNSLDSSQVHHSHSSLQQGRQPIPVVHSSRSNLISVPLQGSARAKADSQSQSHYGTSPETSAASSTGCRYDRKAPYQHGYSRGPNWSFRPF